MTIGWRESKKLFAAPLCGAAKQQGCFRHLMIIMGKMPWEKVRRKRIQKSEKIRK